MIAIQRAELALEGLSLGDAFGQMFFGNGEIVSAMVESRALPAPPWYLTDDSIMAIGIVETLRQCDSLDRDYLAERFAINYKRNPRRGYGGMAHHILRSFCQGKNWRDVAPAVFDGTGSYGNGAAMRVAPLGAYFAEDLNELRSQAYCSAEVTHSHPEGKAGAIAVSLAAAWAWNNRQTESIDGKEMLAFILDLMPDGDTKTGIAKALQLPLDYKIETAVSVLGNGTRISSQDTVPFALWCAARHLDNFEEAIWNTVSGWGDRDTTCAIVGGIVALKVGIEGIPKAWIENRESLTDWEECEVNCD
ncbi:MAG: ADP-ribosylglycohydrolase family protein [Xenococcaceae cyanobacterium]